MSKFLVYIWLNFLKTTSNKSIGNSKLKYNINKNLTYIIKGVYIFKHEILLFEYLPCYAGGGGAMESIDVFNNTLVFSGLCIMIDILAV